MTGIGCGERGRVGFGYNPCGLRSSRVIVCTNCLTFISVIGQAVLMFFKVNDGSTSSVPVWRLLPSLCGVIGTVSDSLRALMLEVEISISSTVSDVELDGIESILVD